MSDSMREREHRLKLNKSQMGSKWDRNYHDMRSSTRRQFNERPTLIWATLPVGHKCEKL